MSIEAMKQVIELYDKHCYNNDYGGIEFNKRYGYKFIEAIEALRTAIQQEEAQQPATGESVAWRNVIPGGRKTDEWESTRIADYNLGWNAYRKAALEHLETSTQPLPSAWMYTLEYGGTIADTKVSLRQLNYPFGVCGADYLRENSDGISYVRQTPLYAHPPPMQAVHHD